MATQTATANEPQQDLTVEQKLQKLQGALRRRA